MVTAFNIIELYISVVAQVVMSTIRRLLTLTLLKLLKRSVSSELRNSVESENMNRKKKSSILLSNIVDVYIGCLTIPYRPVSTTF